MRISSGHTERGVSEPLSSWCLESETGRSSGLSSVRGRLVTGHRPDDNGLLAYSLVEDEGGGGSSVSIRSVCVDINRDRQVI